jgi:hypothetical protein
LNLASTANLAWQQRKAASFTVTPLSCGSADLGYRKTGDFGDPDHGISVGTAMTVSGAAISPNQGYHSSPSMSFLLAALNVRLGWWFGNPGRAGDRGWLGSRAPYRRTGPGFAADAFFNELFGLTNEDRRYVYLTDGGHFENLGLYEMVRRRCRYVVVSDAGQDGVRGFEDLGNAVRKIWIDLGVRVTLNKPAIFEVPDTKGLAKVYLATGTIEYVSDPSGKVGTLLYLKPALIGSECAADIIAYGRAHAEFPHQSTTDQWFDEPQLEAYRALGQLVVNWAVRCVKMSPGRDTVDGLITALASRSL